MNYIDIFLGIVFVIAIVKGYSRGFIVEIFSLFAFFLGIFVAIQFTAPVSVRFFGDSTYFEFIAIGVFIALFIGLTLAINILAKGVKKVLDLTPFGMFDNVMGSLFSIFKLGLILSVIFWIIGSIGIELPKDQAKNSVILPYIIPIGPKAFELVGSIIPYFKNVFDSIEDFSQRGKLT